MSRMFRLGMLCGAHDDLHRLKARCCRRDNGNENKRFLTGVQHTMNFSAMGYQHISLGNGNRLASGTNEILAATGKNGPGILAIRMYMSRNTLTRFDMPSHDR